jgi:hypothetical protein
VVDNPDESGFNRAMAESLFADNRVYLEDARLDGSFVRITWHADDRQFVLSHWRDDVCVAASRLPLTAVADLIALLAKGLGEAASMPPLRLEAEASPPLKESWWERGRARLARIRPPAAAVVPDPLPAPWRQRS